jgi:hypothetical protein
MPKAVIVAPLGYYDSRNRTNPITVASAKESECNIATVTFAGILAGIFAINSANVNDPL